MRDKNHKPGLEEAHDHAHDVCVKVGFFIGGDPSNLTFASAESSSALRFAPWALAGGGDFLGVDGVDDICPSGVLGRP